MRTDPRASRGVLGLIGSRVFQTRAQSHDTNQQFAHFTPMRALRPGSCYLGALLRSVLAGNRRDGTRLLDLEMMVLTGGGRERTKPEFRRLFHAAGLRLVETAPLRAGIRLLVGVARETVGT